MQNNAVVNLTDLGVLQGSVEMTKWTRTPIYRFLGVKYAESPSGNRRFKVKINTNRRNDSSSSDQYNEML